MPGPVPEPPLVLLLKAVALRPDAVVMDMAMRLDGWEATRRLKASPILRPRS